MTNEKKPERRAFPEVVTHRKDETIIILKIRAWPEALAREITVSKVLQSFEDLKPEPANVNWPALGSVTPGDAENFAAAILLAVSEARTLDELYPVPKRRK